MIAPIRVARLLLFVAAACVAACFVRPAVALAAPTYVDKRVTALPAATLLSEPAAKLVDPRRQLAGRELRAYSRPLSLLWALSQILAFFYLWGSGYGARLRDQLRRSVRSPLGMRFMYGALLAALAALAALPVSLVRYRFDLTFGLTTESALEWVRDGLVTVALQAFLVGAVVSFVFALVDRTRLWYLYAMGGLFVLTLATAFLEPVVVAPLYNRFSTLPPTAVARRPLLVLAKRAGIHGAPIMSADDSRRTSVAIADIAGFGPTKRIVLSDALLNDATTGEVLFLAAREFGHYAHADDFRLSLFWTFLFMLCTALAVLIADRIGFRRDDDPLARLSLVLGLLGLLGIAATPLYNAYSRNIESRADTYALALTGDRVSAIRAYVRLADETLAPLCPPRAVRLYYYNSPPLGTRIARAAGRPDPCR